VFSQAPESVQARTTVGRDRYESVWADLLSEANDAGVLRTQTDLRLTRLFLLGALNATVEWFGEGTQELDDLADEFIALFFDGASRKDTP
jgi:hypothetical protein